MYEFYPGPGVSSHISNCTESWEPNIYGAGTWAMCCEIAEICSNNKDDDLNIWFDCVDNSVCSEPGNYQPCGLSDNFKHDPTCSWLSSECDPLTGECDFTPYSEPYWIPVLNTFGYKLPFPGFESCELIRVAGVWQTQGVCPPGTDENNITLPPGTAVAVTMVHAYYMGLGLGVSTDRYELYAKCRSFYCSVGRDVDNPLPPIMPNMTQNHTETRHCCPNSQYWDPTTNKCADFDFCYKPDLLEECLSDFNTDLSGWADDVYGATNPLFAPDDCVRDYLIDAGITDDVLCCPVWSGGLNIYDYVDITYYIQQ